MWGGRGSGSYLSKSRESTRCWFALSAGVFALELFRIAESGLWIDQFLQGGLHTFGWYERRRILQLAAITIFIIVSLTIFKRVRIGSGVGSESCNLRILRACSICLDSVFLATLDGCNFAAS